MTKALFISPSSEIPDLDDLFSMPEEVLNELSLPIEEQLSLSEGEETSPFYRKDYEE